MTRPEMLGRLRARASPWDIVVVGGGATGVGVAVDAASRGYDVLLLEKFDFGKGTSSRSTKLVHGGVRYLEKGDVPLVMEALKERGIMRENAPHLVHDLAFLVPNYDWWEGPFYGIGMRVYDLLAGKYGFGPSSNLNQEETLALIPTLRREGLRGGVRYYDGQFDDARLLINMAQTAAEQGATLVNYVAVTGLLHDADGFVGGVRWRDDLAGTEGEARAKVVVNAAGPFSDDIRRMSDPAAQRSIAPSQGIHLVFDRDFLPGETAIMVPHTSDGRVLFAIPWHGHTLVGTTDTPIAEAVHEPKPFEEEIEFVLSTAADYLSKKPSRADILSVFVGIRPLVKQGEGGGTAALSRDHHIGIGKTGLVSIAGGKWTTYRHMAEDCVNQAATIGDLEERPCVTRKLRIHGYHQAAGKFGDLAVYGSDAVAIEDMMRTNPELSERLHPALPYCAAEVVWAVRHEMAMTVEDVLARRTRALFLNARAAIAMAPRVAALMSDDPGWRKRQIESFTALAAGYCV